MGTEIQEPGQLPDSALTDATAENFALLAYEKRDDGAGLKKLNLVPWKNYLNFNGYAVKNVGALCGFSKTQYDVDHERTDIQQTDTLVYKINALQSNTGVASTPGATPLTTQISEIKTQVGNPSDDTQDPPVAATGMCLDIETNATNISNLTSIVGTPASGSNTVVQRLTTNEANISDLQTRTTTLETTVGNDSTGMRKEVNDLNLSIYGDTSSGTEGLVQTVNGLIVTVSGSDGLTTRVSNLESAITPLEQQVVQNTQDITDLQTKISSTYKVMGTVNQTMVDNWESEGLYETMENGSVWNVDNGITDPKVTFHIPLKAGGTESLTVDNGGNVVWIVSNSTTDPNDKYEYGYFDKLSSTIVDERIPVLQQQVSDLSNLVGNWSSGTTPATGICKKVEDLQKDNYVLTQTSSVTWASDNETGTYMICGVLPSTQLGTIIISLNNGMCLDTSLSIIELNGNTVPWTSLIIRDSLTAKVSAVPTLNKFTIRKIGD